MHEFDFSFQAIVEAAQDVVVVTKADSVDFPGPEIVYVNKAFTQLTGYSFEEAVGKTPRILQSERTDPAAKAEIRKALTYKKPVRITINNRSKYGQDYWLDLSILPLKNSAGEVTHFVAIERDVTNQKELEIELSFLSNRDPLTGLFNRRALEEFGDKEFARYLRKREVFCVLMLDIDHFKEINDRFGHSAGDDVLTKVSQLCLSHFRMQDVIARVGGEEFCIILPTTEILDALKIANRLCRLIAETTFCFADAQAEITASIGGAEIDEYDISLSKVIERADQALYRAKKTGRNKVCFEIGD